MESRKTEMKREGLRIAPGKVRRREHCYLPPISIVVLFSLFFILNVISLFAI